MILSDITIRRPVLATVLNLVIILMGVVVWQRLELREYPRVDLPVVSVNTFWRGASSDIMETQVTKVLEDSLAGIEGIDYISSTTKTEQSEITVRFAPDVKPDSAAADVRDRVSQARGNLPTDIDEPVIGKASADATPIIFIALSSATADAMAVTALASRVVRDRLQIIPGVARADIYGKREYAMRLWLDPEKLAAYQLTPLDVETALRAQNVEIPAGRIEAPDREFVIRAEADLKTPEEFANITLRQDKGYLVRVGDVARVELAPADTRVSSRRNGVPSVALGVVKQSTANPLEISQAVRAALPEIRQLLPAGVSVDLAYDSTVFISASIKAVYHTIAEAIALVALVIFLFLRTWRASLVPIVTIPISLLGGLVLVYVMGFSINLLTLLAFVLAVGLVVDDAIVMLENIARHIENGMKPVDAALRGSREIAFAVIAMTLTLAAVYAPIALAQGQTGRLFVEFALTLAGTVVVSGFIALTLTPMLCAKLLRATPHTAHAETEPAYVRWYRARLTRSLSRRGRVFFGAGLSLFFSLVLFIGFGGVASIMSGGALSGLVTQGRQALAGLAQFGQPGGPPAEILKTLPTPVQWLAAFAEPLGVALGGLPRELAPTEDQGFFIGVGLGPDGATINATLKYAEMAERIYNGIPEHETYFVISGMPAVSQMLSFIMLRDWAKRDRSAKEIIGSISPQMMGIPGMMAFPILPGGLGQDFLDTPVGLVIQTTGSWEDLARVTMQVMAKAAENPALQNMRSDLYLNNPELHISIHRDKVAALNVSMSELARTLQTLLGGLEATRFRKGGDQYDVLLKVGDDQRQQPADISNIYVRSQTGAMIQLANVVDVTEAVGPRDLGHFNKLRAATLTATLGPGTSQAAALSWLENIVRDTKAEGISLDYLGSSREFKKTSGDIGLVFVLALVFIYLVLAAQFESFRDPFIILVSVPLAMFGALLALALTGKSINIYSQIGLITLVGLIAKNGILVVEFANQLQEEGRAKLDAVIEAATLRLRPVLMTSFSMILGAVPLALAHGAGAESRQTIGWVIVGGMTIGTLFTLFVVPAVYTVIAPELNRSRDAGSDV